MFGRRLEPRGERVQLGTAAEGGGIELSDLRGDCIHFPGLS